MRHLPGSSIPFFLSTLVRHTTSFEKVKILWRNTCYNLRVFIDPFMQPRGAPSSFGSLKEEPLRASWPAMLVDPSWYVSIFIKRNMRHLLILILVTFIQPLVLLRHILKSNHQIIYVKAIFFILLWHSMIEVVNQLKSNVQRSLDLLKKKW